MKYFSFECMLHLLCCESVSQIHVPWIERKCYLNLKTAILNKKYTIMLKRVHPLKGPQTIKNY